ncbi:hypothetical protein ScPMuIL_001342 [Solemya velum]
MAFGRNQRVFTVNFFIILLCPVVASLPKPGFPVVIVPGDGGSQIFAKLNKTSAPEVYCVKKTDTFFNMWLNLEELAPFVIDCFVDNMKLNYNNQTRKTSNQPGVETAFPGFGDTQTIEWLDPTHIFPTTYFSPIVEAMLTWGYQRNVSVRGAPFDFRKSPNEMSEFYKDLQALVEETYEINNNTRVVMMGHSMGNPVLLYFFNYIPQAWKDKYIQAFISLASPWAGAVKTLRLFASGDNLGVPIVKPITVRPEQRAMTSTAFLMPTNKYWNNSEVLVVQPHRNYTVNDYKQFFEDIGFMTGFEMWKDTSPLIYDLDPPNVELHCLHGNGIETPGTLLYTEKTWPDSQPAMIPDQGDGTVNIRSLMACTRWQNNQKGRVVHKVFPNAEHMAILANEDVIKYIQSVVLS